GYVQLSRLSRDPAGVRQGRQAGDAGGEVAEVGAPGGVRGGGEAEGGGARSGLRTHAVAG
ncbi:hypothetical protein, partial [Salmonella enterica]|uniref:hypothetical protein n=1 Tax=Salmonella enterica TaxID=28901 RepID=UPI00398C33C7